jgi:hypothetical protein
LLACPHAAQAHGPRTGIKRCSPTAGAGAAAAAAAAQVHVLNGERYKEVCPENTLLNSMQLRSCIIASHQKKPLLKRENALGVTEDARIFLPVEVRV